jgi:hypothetical protein
VFSRKFQAHVQDNQQALRALFGMSGDRPMESGDDSDNDSENELNKGM